MPVSLEEYQVAQTYMVLKMQRESASGNEGVEIVENKPFEDDVYGKGQFTSKVYRLQSKAPGWLKALAPNDALIMLEESWNAYPRCKTVIKCPYFAKFSLTIETIHKADRGNSENVHCLSKEKLAARQVETIDIASAATDYWSYAIGSSSLDLSKFKSAKTGRGPLLNEWQEMCNPVMTAYKLVTVDAPYWGFGYRIEQALIAGERALFLDSHRNCFGWIDEWFGMTMQQLNQLERGNECSASEKTLLKDAANDDERISHTGKRLTMPV